MQSARILPCTTLGNPRRRRKAGIVSASSDWALRHEEGVIPDKWFKPSRVRCRILKTLTSKLAPAAI